MAASRSMLNSASPTASPSMAPATSSSPTSATPAFVRYCRPAEILWDFPIQGLKTAMQQGLPKVKHIAIDGRPATSREMSKREIREVFRKRPGTGKRVQDREVLRPGRCPEVHVLLPPGTGKRFLGNFHPNQMPTSEIEVGFMLLAFNFRSHVPTLGILVALLVVFAGVPAGAQVIQ